VNKKKDHGPPTAGPLDDGTLRWLDRIISPASRSRRPLSEVVDEYRSDIRLFVLGGGKDLMRFASPTRKWSACCLRRSVGRAPTSVAH
jgi:hypothetical protein